MIKIRWAFMFKNLLQICFLNYFVRGGDILFSSSYPSEEFETFEGEEVAILTQAPKFLPGQTVNWKQYRDERRVGNGIQNAITMANNSTAISGSWSSKVSIPMYDYYHYIGVPGITLSSSALLSDKFFYSTVIAIAPYDDTYSGTMALLISKLGWSSFGIINSLDAWSLRSARTIIKDASKYNVTVQEHFEFTPNMLKDKKKDLISKLISFVNSNIRIIVLRTPAAEALIVLEEAHKLGMVGNKEFVWLFLDSTLNENTLNNWKYGLKHPDLLRGIIILDYDCDNITSEYKFLKNELSKGNASYTFPKREKPGTWHCFAYDAILVHLNTLKKTLDFLSSKGIDPDCLKQNFFFNNPKCRKSNQNVDIWPEMEKKIIKESGCENYKSFTNSSQNNCTHCGVCSSLYFFSLSGRHHDFHYYHIYVLNELYKSDLVGSTGRIKFDSNGGRDIKHFKMLIRNTRVFGTKDNPRFGFADVGSLDIASARMTYYKDNIEYPGGTFGVGGSNYERPRGSSEPIYHELSLTYQIPVLIVISATLLICIICYTGFFYYREELIIKTSTPSMMYVMLTGCIFCLVSLLAINIDLNDFTCVFYAWTGNIGWVLIFGSILLKTYRIKVIFNFKNSVKSSNKTTRQSKNGFGLTNLSLMLVVGAMVLVMIIYLTIWTTVSIFGVEYISNWVDNEEIIERRCHSTWFRYSLTIIELAVVLGSIVLAYNVKGMPSYFNEARIIAFSIYNWVIWLGIAEVMLLVNAGFSEQVRAAIQTFSMWIRVVVIVLSFFIYKLWKVFDNKSENEKTGTQPTGKVDSKSLDMMFENTQNMKSHKDLPRASNINSNSFGNDLTEKISNDRLSMVITNHSFMEMSKSRILHSPVPRSHVSTSSAAPTTLEEMTEGVTRSTINFSEASEF